MFYFHGFNLVENYFTVKAQWEAAKLKAEQKEHRALCKKKALQKANQQAGLEPGSEEEFQPWANPSVCLLSFLDLNY